MTHLEEVLEEAQSLCRGRMMTEDEWQRIRGLWIDIGMALGPCRPPEAADLRSGDTTDYDRAMKGLK